ncbi:hypothetical protein V6N12_067854 [Hibiscus sabdariffa]|uniref:Uncharacterized protein n=1 Tax=Hibiscus sabdariffa TaxID=183260 RepID=A0ABR2FN98_9ROSI
MNRLWEDNMLEDWRVLESSVAELGKRNGEVPGVGTALVVAEVDEPGLNVSNEVLGRMRGIWHWFFAWPRSDVPRAGKAATIDLNGEQRRCIVVITQCIEELDEQLGRGVMLEVLSWKRVVCM